MPFIPHTPESFLRRSDSKNPATTCKGVTTTGTHCRRSITASPSLIPGLPHHRRPKTAKKGVVAILEPGDAVNEEGAAAFFCWQHKEQATTLTSSVSGSRTANIVNLKSRTSVDTLVERLGLLETNDRVNSKSKRTARKQWSKENPARKGTLPKQWQDVEGPLLAVHGRRGEEDARRAPKRYHNFLAALCCIASPDVAPLPPSRIRIVDEKMPRKQHGTAKVSAPARLAHPAKRDNTSVSQQQQLHTKQSPASLTQYRSSSPMSTSQVPRPRPRRTPSSQTRDLLSYIPMTLPPQTTSLLLAELAKPVSPHDEAGYIYMFWLTPSSSAHPDDETASSLLADDDTTTATSTRGRRRSELVSSYSSPTTTPKKTLLLKIGRASNVQRRMNQWTRQCGYDLSLIRFYPYLPTSTTTPTKSQALSPQPFPRRNSTNPSSFTLPSPSLPPPSPNNTDDNNPAKKVPHAHKVERLIHLELADKRAKQQGCEACGKEHREWFEVEGTREGLKDVDGVVRRWVAWAQSQPGGRS